MKPEIPLVRDWISDPWQTIGPDEEMAKAVELLSKERFAAIPVLDEGEKVVGLLSEKDCLRAISRWIYEGVAGGTVRDYMSPVRSRITPDMDLLAVAGKFLETNFSCLPVLDGEKLIGRIRRHDILAAFMEWQSALDKANAHAGEGPGRPSSIEEMQRVIGSMNRDQAAERFRKG
jgi:CBS-domain-containing membrane protein